MTLVTSVKGLLLVDKFLVEVFYHHERNLDQERKKGQQSQTINYFHTNLIVHLPGDFSLSRFLLILELPFPPL